MTLCYSLMTCHDCVWSSISGIDDGYWKGYVNGQSGMFPSVVVEEIEDNSYAQHVSLVCEISFAWI